MGAHSRALTQVLHTSQWCSPWLHFPETPGLIFPTLLELLVSRGCFVLSFSITLSSFAWSFSQHPKYGDRWMDEWMEGLNSYGELFYSHVSIWSEGQTRWTLVSCAACPCFNQWTQFRQWLFGVLRSSLSLCSLYMGILSWRRKVQECGLTLRALC